MGSHDLAVLYIPEVVGLIFVLLFKDLSPSEVAGTSHADGFNGWHLDHDGADGCRWT